jgi:glycosyltransferase involved in cell wall biosynthesis
MDVSVIIPTYNRLWCLSQAIDSCRSTACKTEIIVIDDGSTDDTWQWLKEQQDLVIVKQDHLGKAWAVNKGYELAKGKYVRFLDSDDLLNKDAVDEQFKLAEDNASDVVVSGYSLFDEPGNIIRKQRWLDCDDFVAQQLGECDGSHYAAFLFTKNILRDIPHRPDYALRDDRMLILEIAVKTPKIAVHSGYALMHRVHQNNRLQFNVGLQQAVQNFQHLNIYKYIINKLDGQGNLNKRRISASVKILWPLAHWIAITHLQDAENVVEWIYQLDPDFIIPEKGLLGQLYKQLGFTATERLLKIRRSLKYGAFSK